MIDGIFTPPIIAMPNILHMVYEFVNELTSIPSSSSGFGFAHTSNGKTYTKVKMLQSQSNNFANMAHDMVVNSEDQRTLIKEKIEVNIE